MIEDAHVLGPTDPRSWIRDSLRLFSPGRVKWNRVELTVSKPRAALDGLRILHLSDLHLGRCWFRAYDRLLEQIASRQFDLIAVTGDVIDKRWNPAPAVLRHMGRFLDALQARLGVYVILGNHDGDLLAPHVAGAKASLLHPGIARVQCGDTTIELIGLPCVHRFDLKTRLLRRIGSKPGNTLRIVLSHYPDHALRIRSLEADLILAGHTHGGQVCLPSGRPIITHDRLPKEMSHGVHRVGGSWLIVSRGLGFATYPVRLFAPPEVAEIVFGSNPAGQNAD